MDADVREQVADDLTESVLVAQHPDTVRDDGLHRAVRLDRSRIGDAVPDDIGQLGDCRHSMLAGLEVPCERPGRLRRIVGDTIVVVGSTRVTFSDPGAGMPRAPIVVSGGASGVLELLLLPSRS